MKIALIGEYAASLEPHKLTNVSIEHAAKYLDVASTADW